MDKSVNDWNYVPLHIKLKFVNFPTIWTMCDKNGVGFWLEQLSKRKQKLLSNSLTKIMATCCIA